MVHTSLDQRKQLPQEQELEVSLARLKWATVIVPLLFIVLLEVLRRLLGERFIASWTGYLLLGGVLLVATLLFSEAVFAYIGRLQARLLQQNKELLALHEAGVDISSDLDLEAVLQRIVDRARILVGARYGALSILKEGKVEHFVTSGIAPEERERIGSPPSGHGLLGIVLEEGKSLRLRDLTRHPRSVGFPPHHPVMRSLLAVPITSHSRVVGNLYLTEKEGATEFSDEDERTLRRFATQAALAIDNARLHSQVWELAITQERTRIAREMHDGLAQVLGYVNLKAQAVGDLLRSGRTDRALLELDKMAEAAREAYRDLREQILALRVAPTGDGSFLEALRTYLEQWEEQSGIRVDIDVCVNDLHLSPRADLQLLRILQEALANVRKHSGATRVKVVLREKHKHLEAVVEDDGRGFDPAGLLPGDFPKFGLAIMRERAESIGAYLDVESSHGAGTRVRVYVPIDNRD